MKLKALIFDKDGTLLDFAAFWLAVTEYAVADILETLNVHGVAPEEIYSAFGVENGEADIEGVLCRGTYKQMGEAVQNVLSAHGIDVCAERAAKVTADAYRKNKHRGEVRGDCNNIKEVIEKLKSRGLLLAVLTSDGPEFTQFCLDALEITDYFDEIYTDDGTHPPKPDPHCIFDFCRKYGVRTDETAMVGDTMSDMGAAERAGVIGIGVAKNEKNRQKLKPHAYFVVSTVAEIEKLI